jgi:hypothetical protein
MTPWQPSNGAQDPVGIVAGWGQYPVLIARSLHAAGVPTVIVAIRDHASPELEQWSDRVRWLGVCKLGAHRRWLRKHGAKQVALAGKLFKDRILFHGLGWMNHLPDLECLRTFYPHFMARTSDTRDDSLLGAIVQSFERAGMKIVPGTDFVPSLLIETGTLSASQPGFAVLRDMEFGWRIAKQMGELDIGQSVTVRDQTVLCVEAVEGTDACIERTGQVCPRGGFTLVKVAKPKQDMRFDLPTIGLQTLQRFHRAGGKAILVESEKTILIDRQAVLDYANRHRISLVAWSNQHAKARIGHRDCA